MAESAEQTQVRHEWHELLVGVKTTVEGLLATQSTNVWNMYGGLSRLRNDVARILNHRLKVTQGPYGSVLDYWNFVRGLRWLAPMLSPSIEQMNQLCQASGDLSPGQTWVRQSLLNHSLSSQLTILVASAPHLHHHYYDDAFLCQQEYLHAMLICLQAVEQNKPAILAELNPTLLSTRRRTKTTITLKPKVSHVRSASLPINAISEGHRNESISETDSTMIRRTSTSDRLAPPCRSPKTDTILNTSEEYALPSIESSSESAKDALRQVLNRAGDTLEIGDNFSFYDNTEKHADPLMNMEIYQSTGFNGLTRRASSLGIIEDGIHSRTEKSQGLDFQRKQSLQNHSTKSSELLDYILNTDSHPVVALHRPNSHSTSLQPSAVSISEIQVIAESPDLCGTNEKQESVELQTSSSLIMTDSQVNSADSGLSSSPPPLQSVNFLTFSPKKLTHHRSVSDHGVLQKVMVVKPPARMAHSPPNDMSSSLPANSYKNGKPPDTPNMERRSSDLYFPQPTKGQSLLSFLSSQDFHTCAELDKENAHFSISEALIAAIEQMKWNQVLRPQQTSDDHEEGDSDEEIQALKQRIRIRRRECMKEKARGFPAFGDKTDPGTTFTTTPPSGLSQSSSSPIASSPPTESSSAGSSGLDEDIHDTEITDAEVGMNGNNLTTLKESGLSLSLASLYSDADLQKASASMERVIEQSTSTLSDISVHHVSAESVAISLLKRFSEKQLPKASELEWLVSEQEAPQALLPLPNSYPVSPDDHENADLTSSNKMTRLRGNLEWAPPRAQIIFNVHPPPKRKVVLAKQNYCCAGCGAKVEPGYMKRYRYCEYLGKYFCPRCHTNSLAYIPGRVLRKWDFTKYYVSNFACDLLNKRYNDPLFNVEVINLSLYRRVRLLDSVRECRIQLGHLKVFLQTCRNGQSMLQELEKVPTHWVDDIHMYSLGELVMVKKNELLPQMKWLVQDAVTHVQQCQLCQAKGFICEMCNHDNIIFPFDLVAVVQCTNCRSCFHKTCFIPDSCPKCARLEARLDSLARDEAAAGSDSQGPVDGLGE